MTALSKEIKLEQRDVQISLKTKLLVTLLASFSMAAVILFIFLRAQAEHPETPVRYRERMVRIPSGQFLMGNENQNFDEKPVHEVALSAFSMDRYEVTYKEYHAFLVENPDWRKGRVDIDKAGLNYLLDWEGMAYPPGKENYPVLYVSWFAAKAYAQWAGKQLPTESQWEFAARGGVQNRDYPWGNEFRPYLAQWQEAEVKGAIRVGSYTINGFGLNDMVGNVREWTADGYELYQPAKETDPLPTINNHHKVVRGGSWKSTTDELRISTREKLPPNASLADLGFRCVSTK